MFQYHLTLRDRLSRLTFRDSSRLLGPRGSRWITEGGKQEIAIDEQVELSDRAMVLTVGDARATLQTDSSSAGELRWDCSRCEGACEHVGALLSLVLEEKTALGLAVVQPTRVPVEALGESELVERALREREERAAKERMEIRSSNPKALWTDYTVTNHLTGSTYRVALQGWERGESYCACPDFRKNTLGTCKHLLHVVKKLRRSPLARNAQPYRRENAAVHLRYGETVELRFDLPDGADPATKRLAKSFLGTAIHDIRGLLDCVGRLERKGIGVTFYPDAEEHVQRRLAQERLEKIAAEIRRDAAKHPLRKTLLRAELLPYQLDGIAFAVGAGRAVLADDMGLGKTIQAIGVAEILAREAGIGKVLIVCPASLKSQWRAEIARFSSRSSQLVLGGAAERARQYSGERFFTVCNYEQVLRDILAIEREKWDLIVLVEPLRRLDGTAYPPLPATFLGRRSGSLARCCRAIRKPKPPGISSRSFAGSFTNASRRLPTAAPGYPSRFPTHLRSTGWPPLCRESSRVSTTGSLLNVFPEVIRLGSRGASRLGAFRGLRPLDECFANRAGRAGRSELS